MSEFKCDICCDSKRVRLPTNSDIEVANLDDDLAPTSPIDPRWKEFDCPQCVATVPYRRVRALSVAVQYPTEAFGKFSAPIERLLAARFGEYLMREGLLKFSQTPKAVENKIVVTARLGVVSRTDVVRTGAVEELATTVLPGLPRTLTEREPRQRVIPWTPNWADEALITDDFDDEPKDALGARFSGLEI